MIIDNNQVPDKKYFNRCVEAVDKFLAKDGLVAGISGGHIVDAPYGYMYASFTCEVYSKNEPEDSQEFDYYLFLVRLGLNRHLECEVVRIESPFF